MKRDELELVIDSMIAGIMKSDLNLYPLDAREKAYRDAAVEEILILAHAVQRKGGAATKGVSTKKKAKSSAKNGKLGVRPRKYHTHFCHVCEKPYDKRVENDGPSCPSFVDHDWGYCDEDKREEEQVCAKFARSVDAAERLEKQWKEQD